jgi:hypothetical protein
MSLFTPVFICHTQRFMISVCVEKCLFFICQIHPLMTIMLEVMSAVVNKRQSSVMKGQQNTPDSAECHTGRAPKVVGNGT